MQRRQRECFESTGAVCYYCNDNHYIFACTQIPKEYKGRCVNCWADDHMVMSCNNVKIREPWL
ncbi:hypothetical protein RhiirA1_481364 [Rhizophagus irregularis]|nr:hypothetical protein RhiirA1_481364 [Rhizophagus irregularis]